MEDEYGFLDPENLVVDMLDGVHGFGADGEGEDGGDGGGDAAPAFHVQPGLGLTKEEALAQLSQICAKMNVDQKVCFPMCHLSVDTPHSCIVSRPPSRRPSPGSWRTRKLAG